MALADKAKRGGRCDGTWSPEDADAILLIDPDCVPAALHHERQEGMERPLHQKWTRSGASTIPVVTLSFDDWQEALKVSG